MRLKISNPILKLLLFALSLGVRTSSALGQSAEEAIQDFLSHVSGRATVRKNIATGFARFVRMHPDALPDLPAAAVEARADAFFKRYGRMFGMKDQQNSSRQRQHSEQLRAGIFNRPDELQRLGVARTPAMSHVKYSQFHEGVPVFAGVLHASFDSSDRLVAVNGVFVPDLSVSTTPGWSAQEAANVALQLVNGADAVAGTKLYVFRSGMLQGVLGRNHLVWEVEAVNAELSVREFLYIDAHTGKVVDQITGIIGALDRDVSETYLSNVVWTEGNPDPIPDGWSGGSAQQVDDWQDEINGAKETYNLFSSMTGGAYLSYDNKMAQMRSVNNDPSINCPNANWNSVSANYCTGVTADDVVAHEWAHAYTEYINNLIYQWQSGALNESYSDIWGETVDLLNGRGTDAPDAPRSTNGCSIYNNGAPDISYRWLMGEDATAFGTAIRDMWNPTCEGDPGKVTDSQYHCLTSDAGGVHSNSGVPNHAYALMVDGGNYNGFVISSIGITKAARIQFEAQNLLGPASNFVDNADALDAACEALIGATLYTLETQSPTGGNFGQSITAADCNEVAEAVAAVEMRTSPDCNFQPLLDPNSPALCPGGTVQDIFFEDWESGIGSWSVSHVASNPSTFDTPDWAVVSQLPSSRAGSAAFVADLIIGDCAADSEAGVLQLDSPVINIPAGASPQLSFDHWVATELGWDGGNVKVSRNGGSFNLISGTQFIHNPYSGSLNSEGNDNPMAGQQAFTGTDGGSVGGSWGQSQVDLSGLAGPGDNIQIRFEMGLDGCNGIEGWYIDDTRLYTCVSGPCGDGFCAGIGAGEDCNTCGADCPSFGGAICGNGICDAGDGENCINCASDCNGRQTGRRRNRFCCGNGAGTNPVDCNDSRCTAGEAQCTSGSVGGSTCCGDGDCEGLEDSSNCEIDCPNLCGNNIIDSGETCDGTRLGSESCISQGCAGGTLACAGDCLSFDTSACTGCSSCGNNVIDAGETCDGTRLGSESCISQGCTGGTLACANDCFDFDTSGCTGCSGCVPTHEKEKGPRCSDGIDNDCDGLIDGADPDC